MIQSRLEGFSGPSPLAEGALRPAEDCRLCGLCEGRTRLVLPSGDPGSRVAFVGEAPGETEDLTGMPFVGRSGKLLDRLMAEAGLDRSRVMITNTVKCRPPGNRAPTEGEMAACRGFLESELCGKALVVGLGRSACRDLLGYEGRMGDLANRKTRISVSGREIDFLPAYHPAACIYSRASTDSLRETLRRVRDEYL
ncbi:MAG: uracil-DNA glycosylase [Candidatus Methanoplasma sp.]|jgi:DNA polymerase|nr:uracil-DNA glycosylase [Candidatus Methanoplasma sp.]